MILALLLCMAGATNVNAEEISLEEVPFWQHEIWGVNEPKNTQIEVGTDACRWVLGEATDLPYGASNVNDFADVSAYKELVVTLVDGTEGSPRFLFNRDADEGQWNAEESESHLIDNTKGGWSSKYFTQEGNVYTVNIKQLVKDKGYAHLHSIKSAAWGTTVTVESMILVTAGKAKQVGWTNLINNSNMEGDDNSSFFSKTAQGTPQNSEISDGVGVDGSRGIALTTTDKVANDYDNQFWFRFNEPLIAGTKYRVSFDYRADEEASPSTQAHAEPSDYIHYDLFGNINFTTDWQTFTKEAEVTAQQSTDEKKFLSVAFNLNPDDHTDANTYYFDNIKFEVFKLGTVVEFSNDVILVDFGFDTNIPEIVKNSGLKRVFFTDNGCAKVKVNGEDASISSVEGLEDGRFYIFLDEATTPSDDVEVTFTNTIGLVYTSGLNIGASIESFTEIAEYNGAIEDPEDAVPYDYVTPTVMKADPEDGSFNLPTGTNFTITFDKNVDCAALVATANGSPMTVSPNSGFANKVVLSGSLSNGVCKIKLDKIYPEFRIADEVYGEYEFTVNIGVVEIDPNDQPETFISTDLFANCSAGQIPEGFEVMFGEELRTPGNNYGSGPRMFDFGAGGDFTKGLYFREGYCQTNPAVDFRAGKPYTISFNSCMWKSNGGTLDLKILDQYDQEVFSQTVNNTPDVNGSTAAVSGTTKTEIVFIPESDGSYIIRWDRPGFNEVIIGNVKVEYQPNVPGLKETIALNEALEAAKATLAANSDERYQDAEYYNLQSVIGQYEGWSSTSPSAYAEAVKALNEAAAAQNTHHATCDEYDTQIKKAIDVVRQNEMPDGDPAKATKFVTTDLFAQLKSVVAKYNGTSEWRNMNEDPEGEPQWQLFYDYNVLMGESQLQSAIAELKDIANLTSLLFTEGVSAPENANGGKGTGVAVLVDRLRLGVETLKALGASEDDSAIAAFKTALTDDDALAEKIQRHIKKLLYTKIATGEDVFAGVIDENTFEEVTPTYDMTVFVKNPNTYKQLPNSDFTAENVPGWTTPDGYNRPGLTHGWGAYYNIEGVAEDCMFQTWGSSYRVEQTIDNLPGGIYTIRFAFGERNNGDAGVFEDSYAYVVTSSGEETQSPYKGTSDAGDDMYIAGIGQAFPFASNDNQSAIIEDITVTDGQLTIGVNAGPSSHTFFNEVRILMTNKASGFNYTEGIETLDNEAVKARAIELYDLNGRRIESARQGVVILKKHMSDGTIRTEKVVRK